MITFYDPPIFHFLLPCSHDRKELSWSENHNNSSIIFLYTKMDVSKECGIELEKGRISFITSCTQQQQQWQQCGSE
jgi:hypothetical protein